ncbi:MAG: fumarylacetoacetate hydrolase family protein, partial [Pseudomonadota bacterium]
MKLLRYGEPGQEKPGLLDNAGIIRDLSDHVDDITGAVLDDATLARLGAIDPASLPAADGEPRLGPCVGRIGKYMCIGLNYTDHAKEAGMAIPEHPILFMKANSAISGPNDDIVRPRGSTKTDWEVELG